MFSAKDSGEREKESGILELTFLDRSTLSRTIPRIYVKAPRGVQPTALCLLLPGAFYTQCSCFETQLINKIDATL